MVATGFLSALIHALAGRAEPLPPELLDRYPELHGARFRRGGLPLRVGGWCLGAATVSGITLWRTIWLDHDAPLDPGLLLHELRHVHQFQATPLFPLAYAWESLRRGYHQNRFEADARAFATRRLSQTGSPPPNPS
jgi:hypothetical protein